MSASLLSKTLTAAMAATALYALPISGADAQGNDGTGIRAGAFMVYPVASVVEVRTTGVLPPIPRRRHPFDSDYHDVGGKRCRSSREGLRCAQSQCRAVALIGTIMATIGLAGMSAVTGVRATQVSVPDFPYKPMRTRFPDAVANAEPTVFSAQFTSVFNINCDGAYWGGLWKYD